MLPSKESPSGKGSSVNVSFNCIGRPLKNAQFYAKSRKTKILTGVIQVVFRGLKFETDAELVPSGNPPQRGGLEPLHGAKSNRAFFKGLSRFFGREPVFLPWG